MKNNEMLIGILLISGIILTSSAVSTIMNIEQSSEISSFKAPLILGAIETNETITVTRKCSLSSEYPNPPLVPIIRSTPTNEELLDLAHKYGVSASMSGLTVVGGGDVVIRSASETFRTNGLTHYMLSNNDVMRLQNTMSEEAARKIADEFVVTLLKEHPEFPCTIDYYKTVTGSRTRSKDISTGEITEVVHTLKVKYRVRYEGIPMYGNGAGVSVSICNNEIVEFEVHLPEVVPNTKYVSVKTKSAVFQEMLKEPKIALSILAERTENTYIEREVDKIELCYYYDFTTPQTEGNVPLVYLISGTDFLKNNTSIVLENVFYEFIEATH